jgi:ADP-heptose:LPS heptosyltransferase
MAFNGSILETRKQIKKEKFDVIIDLHKNIRSYSVSFFAAKRIYRFSKLNIRKALLTMLKLDYLPDRHVVDRYMEPLKLMGIEEPSKSSSFHIPENYQINTENIWGFKPERYICVALGAKFKTKQIPMTLMEQIIEKTEIPIVLLGDKTDFVRGEELVNKFHEKKLVNCAGKYNLLESANVVQGANKLLTGDTGLMHIASFFDTQIISVWGNTTPKFGMYPYRTNKQSIDVMFEKKGLKCRPCSKIGYDSCPKGHFKCMSHDANDIVKALL